MNSSANSSLPEVSLAMVCTTAVVTVVLASALAYTLQHQKASSSNNNSNTEDDPKTMNDDDTQHADFLERFPRGSLSVYFATQTGTAESFAKQLERDGVQHGFHVKVVDLDDVDCSSGEDDDNDDNGTGALMARTQLAERSIFLTATYGEGEAPDNANAFVQLLQRVTNLPVLPDPKAESSSNSSNGSDPSSCLNHVSFAVFGLGNRQYDHYNAMGKFFDRALSAAGGQRLVPLGLGDDDDDLESDFEQYKDTVLWPALLKAYPAAAGSVLPTPSKGHDLPECPICLVVTPPNGGVTPNRSLPLDQIHTSSRPYFTSIDCPVTCVRSLRPDSSHGSTVHVEIDVRGLPTGDENSHSYYHTADTLGVLPHNRPTVVERVAQALHQDLDAVIQSVGPSTPDHAWPGAPFPTPCTVRECLTRYLDLTGPPRRSDLRQWAVHCTDPLDRAVLERLASPEGKEEYQEKMVASYRGVVDLLDKCRSLCDLPLATFVHLCAPLQARYFTISSSSLVHPETVHLTVAVSRQERGDGTVFEGVCSTHMADMLGDNAAPTLRVFHRPSTFSLPEDLSRPILMIGPGTGVAPMRAFLQERAQQRQQQQQVGPSILYFGCQTNEDFIYRDEFDAWTADGTLDELHVAVSRDPASNGTTKQRVYVQHLLQKDSARIFDLLGRQRAHLYVCGGVAMGHDVAEAVRSILVEHGGATDDDDAKGRLAEMARTGRYIQELWA